MRLDDWRAVGGGSCPLCHDAPGPLTHCCPWHPSVVSCARHADLQLCPICRSEYTPLIDSMPVAVFVPELRRVGPPHGRPAPVMILPRRKRHKRQGGKRGR